MSQLGIPTEGGDGVTVLKQGFNVDPLLQKQADCISTMTYNEYWQVIDAGLTPEDLVVFKYEDQGVATLEDGIYVLEESLQDPAMVDKLARFLAASIKGWEYAAENPDEAADIVLDNDETGAQTEKHQRRMMGEINKLVEGGAKGIGWLDPEAYQRTVDVLMASEFDPGDHQGARRRLEPPDLGRHAGHVGTGAGGAPGTVGRAAAFLCRAQRRARHDAPAMTAGRGADRRGDG